MGFRLGVRIPDARGAQVLSHQGSRLGLAGAKGRVAALLFLRPFLNPGGVWGGYVLEFSKALSSAAILIPFLERLRYVD